MNIEEKIADFVDGCGSPYRDEHIPEGVAIVQEYAKKTSIEFFKWHWNNYSSHPNSEELEERYNEFIKSIEP